MLPFYHPTTIVSLDDDPLFLESFAFHFGEDFVCKTFTRPERALQFLEKAEQHRTLGEDFFSADAGVIDSVGMDPGDQVIKIKSSMFGNLLSDRGRFQQVSLIIADYAMPGMNGVDFCRRLAGHPVKKILLTGKAGEETAVRAFNEGVIDCFLMKQMPDLSSVLDREIRKLQRKYFSEITGPLKLALTLKAKSFLADPSFEEYFLKLYEARRIAEYYQHVHPSGMLMIDGNGDLLFLIVQDEETMTSHLEIAIAENAPAEFISLLEKRAILPLFPTPHNGYSGEFGDTWRNYIWPAEEISGGSKWYCSFIEDAKFGADLFKNAIPFAHCREAIEEADL